MAAWYDLCRKKSSEIRGGEIATVTEEDEWAPESAGDPKTQKLKINLRILIRLKRAQTENVYQIYLYVYA